MLTVKQDRNGYTVNLRSSTVEILSISYDERRAQR